MVNLLSFINRLPCFGTCSCSKNKPTANSDSRFHNSEFKIRGDAVFGVAHISRLNCSTQSGENGIRTRDTPFGIYWISNPALSATQPSLRANCKLLQDGNRVNSSCVGFLRFVIFSQRDPKKCGAVRAILQLVDTSARLLFPLKQVKNHLPKSSEAWNINS